MFFFLIPNEPYSSCHTSFMKVVPDSVLMLAKGSLYGTFWNKFCKTPYDNSYRSSIFYDSSCQNQAVLDQKSIMSQNMLPIHTNPFHVHRGLGYRGHHRSIRDISRSPLSDVGRRHLYQLPLALYLNITERKPRQSGKQEQKLSLSCR